MTEAIERPAATIEETTAATTEKATTEATAAAPPTFGLTKFLDPLRIPSVIRPHARWGRDEITVSMVATTARLHSQLPPTPVWAYNGEFPGPTIEVHSGTPLRVSWTNHVTGPVPFVAVRAPNALAPSTTPGYRNPDGTLPPGVSLFDGVADLPPWTVVHLHGARTGGGNDGWAHNAVLPGGSQLAEYPNAQPGMTLWYHDHAMAITRFNVYAGLMGMYLVRDAEEEALDLPSGRHEIPLILTDRNLDTAPDGTLTGRLLYKVGTVGTAEAPVHLPFSGPFTLVNGVIWPHAEVEPRWYRFRVLNASNSRSHTLDLVDADGVSHRDAVWQIGTDGGLLPAPIRTPDAGLTLAPAERADLLIDFGAHRGRSLRLTNRHATAAPEPDVMEFRVADRKVRDRFQLPEVLSPSFVRLHHGTTLPDDHDHVWVAFVPPGTAGEAHPGMWELAEITDPAEIPAEGSPAAEGIIQLTDPGATDPAKAVRTFRRVASLFDESTTIFLDHGRWAVWNLINLGGPVHPLHIHLTELQALSRRAFALTGNTVTGFNTAVGGTDAPLPAPSEGNLDANEEGWKDTFRVGPGEWVSVAGEFVGGNGSFMYHCHLLEHEDEGMMRPFVVLPREVLRFHHHPDPGGHEHAA